MSAARMVPVRLPLLQLARYVVREVQLCRSVGLCPNCRRSLVALNQELTDVLLSVGRRGVASPPGGVAPKPVRAVGASDGLHAGRSTPLSTLALPKRQAASVRRSKHGGGR